MTKKALGVLVAVSLSLSLCAATASADPTPTPAAPSNVKVLKTVVVVGKRQMPSVVIEIARLSAATEAGAAHETFHAALLEASVPAALRQH